MSTLRYHPEDAANAPATVPKVSIGLPVYNGAETIQVAITAILNQTFCDFELIISDNASTDATQSICEAIAERDSRVRLIRRSKNLGAIANFEAVLDAAHCPYFMFAAADDTIEPHFIEETLQLLEATPTAIACAPRTMIHFDGGRCREARGTAAIRGPEWWRPARFLVRPADNSRYYGLYRTEALRAAYLRGHRFHAFDWAVSALSLSQGAHLRSSSIVLHRKGAWPGKYQRDLCRDASGPIHRFLPVVGMSRVVLSRLKVSQRVLAVPVLLALNALKTAELCWASARGRLRG